MIKENNDNSQHDEFGDVLDLILVMPFPYHQLLNKKMNDYKGQDSPGERPGKTRKIRSLP